MDDCSKITQVELEEMFGDDLPIEVVGIIFNADPSETVGEVRAKVRAFAATLKEAD